MPISLGDLWAFSCAGTSKWIFKCYLALKLAMGYRLQKHALWLCLLFRKSSTKTVTVVLMLLTKEKEKCLQLFEDKWFILGRTGGTLPCENNSAVSLAGAGLENSCLCEKAGQETPFIPPHLPRVGAGGLPLNVILFNKIMWGSQWGCRTPVI